jgi:hypothetical protein
VVTTPVRWRIYYAGGGAFGSEQGSWDEAPLDGVLFVAVEYADGRVERHSGADFYALLDGNTVASTGEITSILRERAPWIKYGVWSTHADLERARERMNREF